MIHLTHFLSKCKQDATQRQEKMWWPSCERGGGGGSRLGGCRLVSGWHKRPPTTLPPKYNTPVTCYKITFSILRATSKTRERAGGGARSARRPLPPRRAAQPALRFTQLSPVYIIRFHCGTTHRRMRKIFLTLFYCTSTRINCTDIIL